MRKYEIIMVLAMFAWLLCQNLEGKKFSELSRCKISFVAFAVAALAIVVSPNVKWRIPEIAMFFGTAWYGIRVFAKDIIKFIKIVLRNILYKADL